MKKEKNVFVIFGRNTRARDMVYDFLRAVGLEPIEWNTALSLANSGAPFIGNIVDSAFQHAQALIILMTGDEIVKLNSYYDSTARFEYQSRPNVIFEAGMAFAQNEDKTIIVQIGSHRDISDLSGRHVVFLDNSIEKRLELIEKLRNAGCDLSINGKTQWADLNKFHFLDTVIKSDDIPVETAISNFYENRSYGQDFETILSMCKKNLVIIGIKFGTIIQQLDLLIEKMSDEDDFYVKFFLLSPIDKYGTELTWINEVEKFNSFGHLLEVLKLNVINLRKYINAIKDENIKKRISIKFYYTLPTASLVFYDKDEDYGIVRVEPFMYKIMPMQRASFDVKKSKSDKLYERYSRSLDLMESTCSIDINDKIFDDYLKDWE